MEARTRAFQPQLLGSQKGAGEYAPPLAVPQPLSASSSLAAAIQAYHAYLVSSLYSRHTVKAFIGDIALLGKFVGLSKRLGEITLAQLESFLAYLRTERGKPCCPKSMNRRVTTLKNFFAWLVESQVIQENPATRLVYKRAIPPLPDILYDDECARLLAEASGDSRDYLLVLLLLETGVKREELLKIKLAHFDLSNPYRPELLIKSEGRSFRERKLRLPPELLTVLRAYIGEYQPQEYLFNCTERSLTYILKDVAQRAGITKRVSCQNLRDTFAVRQLKAGEKIETVFEKLGLAPGTWNEETREKYLRLARPGI